MKLFPGTRFFLLFLLSLFSISMITTALSDPSRVVAAQDDPAADAADAGDAAAEDPPAADAAAGGDGGDQTQSEFEWLCGMHRQAE